MTEGTWFGDVALAYARSRPDYPSEIIDAVQRHCESGPAKDALDIGSGTGTMAKALGDRGLSVVAVEPSKEMVAVARRYVVGSKGPVSFEVTTFESWDPRGRLFDIACCGQAWHWLDRNVALAKAAAVLRPGGSLGVVWNVASPGEMAGQNELLRAYAAVMRRHPDAFGALDARLIQRQRKDRPPVDTKLRKDLFSSGYFESIARLEVDWRLTYTAAEYLDLLRTQREHARLPENVRNDLFEAIATAIDEIGGEIPFGYRAVLTMARRIGGAS